MLVYEYYCMSISINANASVEVLVYKQLLLVR